MGFSVFIAAFGIIIGAPFQFGYGNGVMNSMAQPMKKVFEENGVSIGSYSWYTAEALTTGLWCLGGGIGALAGCPLASYIGRKKSLMGNNIFLLIGSFLQVILLTL